MIELPFPAKILWPNGRGHHMAKHREFQKHKQWAFHAALAAGVDGMPFGRVEWSVTFYPKTRNRIDDDNARASLKAYQDGIALALAVNDSLFPAPTIHFAEPVKNGKVVIVIACSSSISTSTHDEPSFETTRHGDEPGLHRAIVPPLVASEIPLPASEGA